MTGNPPAHCARLSPGGAHPPLLTIFAIPKPFLGRNGIIQHNALASWAALGGGVRLLLLGNEEGTASAAAKFGAQHRPDLPRTEQGTPLVGPAFQIAAEQCTTPLLAYCNADLILLEDWLPTLQRVADLCDGPFLAIGRRTNIELERSLDFSSAAARTELQRLVEQGEPESLLCKDYFVFPRGAFSQLPPFAVGRGNWDSWLVQHAKSRSIPVVDLSGELQVLHQNHGHEHVAGGRVASYWRGSEARANQRLGGGTYWIRGTAADWELTAAGLRRCRGGGWNWPFWRDWPRTARLIWRLLLSPRTSPAASCEQSSPRVAPLGDEQC